MQAILLCGGLGTRLRSVVSDRPKPLADINGRPFMEYVIRELMKHGIDDIIFAAGYKGKMIEDFFGDGSAFGFRAHYAYEESQLGTGGALRNALPYVTEPMTYALNADTFYRIDYGALLRLKEEKQLPMALVTREVTDISRYGEVRTENGLVSGWNEKSPEKRSGEINGGIYLLDRELLARIPEGKHSLENELLPQWLSEGMEIGVMRNEGYFIDIGIPESYRQFQTDVAEGRI